MVVSKRFKFSWNPEQLRIKGGRVLALWKQGSVRPYVIGAMAAAAIGSGLVATQIQPVTIEIQKPHGHRDVKLWTFRHRVKSILAQAHIALSPHDHLAVSQDGHHITIRRAIPVMVNLANRQIRYWSTEYTVGRILSKLSVKLGPMDQVTPPPQTMLSAQGKITVVRRWRVKKRVVSSVPYSVQYQPDSQLVQGNSHVLQAGHKGTQETIRSVTLQNGVAVATQTLSHKLLHPPKPEVIAMGTASPPLLASRGGAPTDFVSKLSMVATGYWPNPSWSTGITATGTRAHRGVVAVDPRVIPLGTHLYVPGYGFAVAEDTGGAIIGHRIDLCFNNGSQAANWGVRQVEVYIVK